MAAALWDLLWDKGGGWRARLLRKDRAGSTLPLSSPCSFQVRTIDAPSSTPALLDVAGAVEADGSAIDITVSPEQISALEAGRYEHRLIVGTGANTPPVVLLRGYVTVRDTLGGG